MNRKYFLESHSFLKRDKISFALVNSPLFFSSSVLLVGKNGFDSDAIAKFFTNPSRSASQVVFKFENAHCFKNRKQLISYLSSSGPCCFHLMNLQNGGKDLLTSLPGILKLFPFTRIIGSIIHNAELSDFKMNGLEEIFKHRILFIPPLSERTDDFPALIKFYSVEKVELQKEALEVLKSLHWEEDASDFREFVHFLDKSFLKSNRRSLSGDDVKNLFEIFKPGVRSKFQEGFNPAKVFETTKAIGFKNTSRLMEALLIEHALLACGGKKNLAARSLHLSPSTLISRMHALAEWMDIK